MNFLEHFYTKTLKYELLNKFIYKDAKELPELKKIILNFGCKSLELKHLAASLLALELITAQKGTLTTTSYSNVLLRIRKGNPTGCKVTLRKNKMLDFISKTQIEIFPKQKNFYGFNASKKIKKNVFSYELHNTFSYAKLEDYYSLFYSLSKLDITIVTSTKTKKELLFVLGSLKFPFKNKQNKSKYNSIGRV